MTKNKTWQQNKGYVVLFLTILILALSFFNFNLQSARAADAKVSNGSHQVILGGHSVGIILQTEGASIVGFSPVINENGESIFPAQEGGLEIGDFITEVNHQEVKTDDEIGAIINDLGGKSEAVTLTINREGSMQEVEVKPVYCSDTSSWRIGLYIRDNTAGIGTLTFYEQDNKSYGALGHLIADLDEKMSKEVEKGNVLGSSIQDIKHGTRGEPGEKIGAFTTDSFSGSIIKNSNFGIFGKMDQNITNPLYPNPVTVSKIEEVKTGPVKILTVISGEKIEEFDAEITKLMPNNKENGKGMVLKITDKRLLDATGGIVQGMSGSPILQDGKLVGAVTHVFVNDPTSGYGCFAQWMLQEITF